MMRCKNNRSRRGYVTHGWVDGRVNALFSALTHDLGRPFNAGHRNVRSVVREWCPLVQGSLDLDVKTFKASYLPAHFLDRYFYSDELENRRTLESQAWESFQQNLGRGYLFNSWKVRFLPYGWLNSILESAALEIGYVLGEFNAERMFELCEHGPNAAIGVRRDNAFLDVKTTCFTGTLHSHDLMRDYLAWNTTLGSYLNGKYPNGLPLKVVEGNRLSFVPKKHDKLRTMMVEPVVNQFFQQGYGNYIAEQLRFRANIDLSNQPDCHRLLCKVISKNGLPIATLDWSEASDRIWLGLVKRLLPSDWFHALETVRSPVCTYRTPGGVLVERELTMAGSMGCGFTFPLMTLLFLCLLRAVARECGHEQFVTVFGDDCIVDATMVDDVARLASELNWKLNQGKSFWTGDFRESCGMDAYRGVNTRPVFIERPTSLERLDIAAWAYGCYNKLSEAMQPHFYPVHVGYWLRDLLKEICLPMYYVPPRYSENCGVRIVDFRQPIPGTSILVYGSDADGWRFSYLSTPTERVPVDPEPYYLWKLTGKGVPQSFGKGVILSEDEVAETDPWPDSESLVPGKRPLGKKRRKGYVHTWNYPYDPD